MTHTERLLQARELWGVWKNLYAAWPTLDAATSSRSRRAGSSSRGWKDMTNGKGWD